MPRVAVVAHADKSFGGGLGELKAALTREGFADPLWYEVKKSRKAAKCARRALARCAEVIFIWGGRRDGPALRRCRGRDRRRHCDPSSRHSESAGGQPGNPGRPHRGGAGRPVRGSSPAW